MFNPEDAQVICDVAGMLSEPNTPSNAQLGQMVNLAATGSLEQLCEHFDQFADNQKFTQQKGQRNQQIGEQFKELARRFHDAQEETEGNTGILKQHQAKRATALKYVTRLRGWTEGKIVFPNSSDDSGEFSFAAEEVEAIRDLSNRLGHPNSAPSQALLGNLVRIAMMGSLADVWLELESLASQGKFTGQKYQKRENQALCQSFESLMFRFPRDEGQSKRAKALKYVIRLRGWRSSQNRPRPSEERRQSSLFSRDEIQLIRHIAQELGSPQRSPSQSLLANVILVAQAHSFAELCLEIDALANQGKLTGNPRQRRENQQRRDLFCDLLLRFYEEAEDEPGHLALLRQNQEKRAHALKYVVQLRGR